MSRGFNAADAQLARRAPGLAEIDYLTEDAARIKVKVFDHCKHPTRQFREWAVRSGVPVKRVGRKRLYDPRILDAFLDREKWTLRHRPARAEKRAPNLHVVPALEGR
jgi:hypothetical protein